MRFLALVVCALVCTVCPLRTKAAEASAAELVIEHLRIPLQAQPGTRLSSADGMVYLCLKDGQVAAFSTVDGGIKWSYAIGSKIRGGTRRYGGYVLLGAEDGTLACLSASDGVVVWKRTISDCVTGAPDTDGKLVYVAGRSGGLHAFHLVNGEPAWDAAVSDFLADGPLCVGGRVYVSTTGSGPDGARLHCFEGVSGKAVFSTQLEGWYGGRMYAVWPAIIVATSGDNGAVWAVEAQSGDILWKFHGEFDSHWGSLYADGQRVYAGCQGQIVALDLATGSLEWTWNAAPLVRKVGKRKSVFYPNIVEISGGPAGHISVTTYYNVASSGSLEILATGDGERKTTAVFQGRLAHGACQSGSSLIMALEDQVLVYGIPSVMVGGIPVVDPMLPCAVMDGALYVPLRPLLSAMGLDVGWDQATNGAFGRRGESVVWVPSHGSYIMVNGKRHELQKDVITTTGRITVPLRAFVAALGGEVEWDTVRLQARVRFP